MTSPSNANVSDHRDFSKHSEVGGEPQENDHTVTSGDDASSSESPIHTKQEQLSIWRRAYEIVYWVPPKARYDPNEPPKFSMAMNVLFAFAGAFTVANLYYNHPILNILAEDFGVPYEKVSQIPTLAQAGYAVGLFFLCPLGDLFKRRPFVLSLVFFTATMSIGLCVTDSIEVFTGTQFLVGLTTVTPQLMLPLVGDLAPPHRRAAALSIVVSGFALGILIARLLSGIMTNYVSWRYVYWMSTALQYIIFLSLWAFMPDYPAMNKGLNYFKMLWSILVMMTKHPILVQACCISYFTSAVFTSFWTVLTFLLAGDPYNYSPVIIGLFALAGIGTMVFVPFYARLVIDRFVPAFSVLLGMTWCIIGVCLGAYTGTFTVAGPIMQAFLSDFGMQTSQIANRSAIYTVEPKGRNRVNTAFMVFTFFGQLTGTSVGTRLYVDYGWTISQSFSVACICVAVCITLARGPWEESWIGWGGGWAIKKKDRTSADGKATTEARNPLRRMTTEERAADTAADPEKGAIGDDTGDETNAEKAALELGDDSENNISRTGAGATSQQSRKPDL